MEEQRGSELRVGIFVFIALAIGVALVFAIGGQQNLFVSKTSYKAQFTDVGGLREGSPVRIAGVSVGTVTRIELNTNGKILVTFGVRSDARRLIREGSVASIASKGMLGDQLLEITVGTGKPIQANGWITTAETAALSKYMQQAGRVLSNAEVTAQNIRTVTEVLADPQLGKDIRDSVHHLSTVLENASSGQGTVNRLLTDRKLAASLEEAVNNLQSASEQLAATAGNVRELSEQARRGPGLVHELLYGEQGVELMTNLAGSTSELSKVIGEIRTNRNSTVHRLLYTDDATELLTNLTEVSRHLKQISESVQAGRGTLGSLLTDPSIYEDIKRLVGNLERNEVLRALVRYSIRHDEAKPNPHVTPTSSK
jgi:phospholipid/cholesterol/gamma-HCH transport system substrate-binding protein